MQLLLTSVIVNACYKDKETDSLHQDLKKVITYVRVEKGTNKALQDLP